MNAEKLQQANDLAKKIGEKKQQLQTWEECGNFKIIMYDSKGYEKRKENVSDTVLFQEYRKNKIQWLKDLICELEHKFKIL